MATKIRERVTINGVNIFKVLAHYEAIPVLVNALRDIAGRSATSIEDPEVHAHQALEVWDMTRVKQRRSATVIVNLENGSSDPQTGETTHEQTSADSGEQQATHSGPVGKHRRRGR